MTCGTTYLIIKVLLFYNQIELGLLYIYMINISTKYIYNFICVGLVLRDFVKPFFSCGVIFVNLKSFIERSHNYL